MALIHCPIKYSNVCQTTNRDECSGVRYKQMVSEMIGTYHKISEDIV